MVDRPPRADPLSERDLRSMSSDDLRDWLRSERIVYTGFVRQPSRDAAERARWASERANRIEAELRRRGSGRLP